MYINYRIISKPKFVIENVVPLTAFVLYFQLKIGDEIEALYPPDGRWYSAQITAILSKGKF